MDQGLIPARYAKALYLTACETSSETTVYDALKLVVKAFDDQPQLQSTLSNPFVSNSDKIKLLQTAASNSKSDDIYSNFLKLLAENSRLDQMRMIAQAYIKLYRQKKQIYEVKVVSASPLSEDEQIRLRKMISQHLNGGTIEYSAQIDPSLIGGFTVNIGNERIDASISNELKQMRLNLISK